MNVSNKNKKELFELLIEYYQLKPENKWCTGAYFNDDKCCALGFLYDDFGGMGDIISRVTVSDNKCDLVKANDGDVYPNIQTPKQRVLQYLKDEISKL